MSRIRSLHPGYWTNEDLVQLPFEARLCFQGLWSFADREGRLEDRPAKLKILIFPADNVDMDRLLQMLADSPGRFIVRYEVDGVRCIQILNWKKYQRPHMREVASELPGPPVEALSREKVGASREKVGASTRLGHVEPVGQRSDVSGQRSDVSGQREVETSTSSVSVDTDLAARKAAGSKPSGNGDHEKATAEAAERILAYWNSKKTLPYLKEGPTRKRKHSLRVIADRLKEGYTVDELMGHVDRFEGKRRAQQFWDRKNDPPDLNSRYWCPNVNWTPDEIFGPERFGRYFPPWSQEAQITGQELEDAYAKRVYGQ